MRFLRNISKNYQRYFSENTAFVVYSVLSTSPYVNFSEPFYKWQLMYNDPDDNKFADMSIAGNADYLVTNDKHFGILQEIEFPKVKIISLDDFKKIIDR